jgi:putative restriction endonuclease
MTSPLSQKRLLEQILNAIDEGRWQVLILDEHKPFRLRLFREYEKGIDIRVFIWNCTHGGGSARAKDEYRVQITGIAPDITLGEVTLLLGWHAGYEVFVGFDIQKHAGQSSQSPSIQIKEDVLQNAHFHTFAIYRRNNGEIAVAFRPEFFVEYALNKDILHASEKDDDLDMLLLNNIETLDEAKITEIKNQERRNVIANIRRKYRASDFRKRVLGAYGNRCAMCGVQLKLIDAAHIIPVAASTSTDETNNGIALCKLHHAAFDNNLLSFDEKFKIELNDTEIARLTIENLVGGLKDFKRNLKTAILLPNDRRDYPLSEYISEARRVRNWM